MDASVPPSYSPGKSFTPLRGHDPNYLDSIYGSDPDAMFCLIVSHLKLLDDVHTELLMSFGEEPVHGDNEEYTKPNERLVATD